MAAETRASQIVAEARIGECHAKDYRERSTRRTALSIVDRNATRIFEVYMADIVLFFSPFNSKLLIHRSWRSYEASQGRSSSLD